MTDKKDITLLLEIAKLIKDYAPELSERIVEALSSQELRERLIATLSKSKEKSPVNAASDVKSAKKKQSKTKFASPRKNSKRFNQKQNASILKKHNKNTYPRFLNDLDEVEPDKYALLVKFYDNLIDGTILSTLQEIRDFASNAGLPTIKATSRNRAINSFIKDLMLLNIDELNKKLETVMPIAFPDDRSFEAWANIILDQEQRE